MKLEVIAFGADLAEWYTVNDQSIESGDLVALTGQLDEYGVPILSRAYGSNKLIGVISTNAGQTYGIKADNRRPLALAGRVLVKIDPDSEALKAGDSITASAIGKARKALVGEKAIGTVTEDWTPGVNAKEKVLIMITQPFTVTDASQGTVNDSIQTQVSRINNLLGISADGTTTSSSILTNLQDVLTQITNTINEFKDLIAAMGISTVKDADGNDVLTFSSKASFLNDVTLRDTTVTGELNVGSLNINSLTNGIEVTGAACGSNQTICEAQTMYIQKNLSGNIDMMNGKVIVRPNGDVDVVGVLRAKKVISEEYGVKGTSNTVGTGVLRAGESEVTINTNAVNGNSKIFVTPTNGGTDKTLSIIRRVDGTSFTVGISGTASSDINFDWFLVTVE